MTNKKRIAKFLLKKESKKIRTFANQLEKAGKAAELAAKMFLKFHKI